MNRNVIYYPYIRVPQNEWFTRVLLYWDQVFSVVPMDYASNPSTLGEYMDGLIREDLVIPIAPSEYIHDLPNFTEAFLDYVDDPRYPVTRNSITRKRVKTFDVAIEKLGAIGDGLIKRGLARQYYGWYKIEAYTANQFMAYLAGTLGNMPDIQSKPITDKQQNLVSFAPHQGGKLYQDIDETRAIILKDILPAPSGNIDPIQLVNFKKDNLTELNRFRNRIESFIPIAANIEDQTIRSETIAQFVTETQDEIDYISESMKSVGWKKITLRRLLAYSTVVGGVVDAVTTGGIAGAITAAFAGATAFHDTAMGAHNTLEDRYTAYAILARERFSNK